MGMTFAQKILAAKAGLDSIDVGQIVEIEPDVCLSHDNTAAIAKKFAKIGVSAVKDPQRDPRVRAVAGHPPFLRRG